MGRSSKRLRRDRELRWGTGGAGPLPRTDERWEGGYVGWEAAPGFGIWVESDDGPIVMGDVLDPGRSPEQECVRLLLEAFRHPHAGPPRLPAQVAVRENGLAELIRAALGDRGVEVLVLEDLPSFEQAAAELQRHLESQVAPGYLEQGIPEAVVAAFYQAAAAFYRAAPWRVASDDAALALRPMEQEEPLYGLLLGGEGVTHGLALYRSRADLERTWAATTFPPPPVDALAVTFDVEGDMAPALAAERRAHRWPLAGPAAFPVPFRTTPANTGEVPDAEELALATTCLRVVVEFVERESRAVRAGQQARGLVTLTTPDASGVAREVTVDVAWPVRPEGGPGAEGGSGLEEGSAPREALRPLHEINQRILALPESNRLLQRLAWSFYGGPSPGVYLESEDFGDVAQASMRFHLWALYFAHTTAEGRTLAQRALDAATDLGPAELAEALRLIRGRYIVGRVLGTEGEDVFDVRLEGSGEQLRLRGGHADEARAGELLLGVAFPGLADEYLLAQATALRYDRKLAALLAEASPEDAPLLAERALENAGPAWIQELSARDVRQAYEEFREDTGGELPPHEELEDMIREAESPMSPLQALAGSVVWLGEAEVEVMAALEMRLWNTTPRPELGGRTPEKASRPPRRRK